MVWLGFDLIPVDWCQPWLGLKMNEVCADSGMVVGLAGCRWVNGFKTDDRMRLVLLLLGEVTD